MADITGEDEWSDWEDEELPAKSLLQDTLLPSAKVHQASIHKFSVFATLLKFLR